MLPPGRASLLRRRGSTPAARAACRPSGRGGGGGRARRGQAPHSRPQGEGVAWCRCPCLGCRSRAGHTALLSPLACPNREAWPLHAHVVGLAAGVQSPESPSPNVCACVHPLLKELLCSARGCQPSPSPPGSPAEPTLQHAPRRSRADHDHHDAGRFCDRRKHVQGALACSPSPWVPGRAGLCPSRERLGCGRVRVLWVGGRGKRVRTGSQQSTARSPTGDVSPRDRGTRARQHARLGGPFVPCRAIWLRSMSSNRRLLPPRHPTWTRR